MCLKKEQLTNSEKPLIPDFLKQLLIYIRALEFDECPDYEKIIKVIDNVYKEVTADEIEDAVIDDEVSDLE